MCLLIYECANLALSVPPILCPPTLRRCLAAAAAGTERGYSYSASTCVWSKANLLWHHSDNAVIARRGLTLKAMHSVFAR